MNYQAFTDDDLKLFKDNPEKMTIHRERFLALLARLELAEKALALSYCLCDEKGLTDCNCEFVKLAKAWRKVAGK